MLDMLRIGIFLMSNRNSSYLATAGSIAPVCVVGVVLLLLLRMSWYVGMLSALLLDSTAFRFISTSPSLPGSIMFSTLGLAVISAILSVSGIWLYLFRFCSSFLLLITELSTIPPSLSRPLGPFISSLGTLASSPGTLASSLCTLVSAFCISAWDKPVLDWVNMGTFKMSNWNSSYLTTAGSIAPDCVMGVVLLLLVEMLWLVRMLSVLLLGSRFISASPLLLGNFMVSTPGLVVISTIPTDSVCDFWSSLLLN